MIYSAQRWATAEEVFDRLIEIITTHPWVKSETGLPDGYSKAGKRGEIKLKNSGHIRIGLRSGDLGRGLDIVRRGAFSKSLGSSTHRYRCGLDAQGR